MPAAEASEQSKNGESAFEPSADGEAFNGGRVDSPRLIVVLNRIGVEAQQRARRRRRWQARARRSPPTALGAIVGAARAIGRRLRGAKFPSSVTGIHHLRRERERDWDYRRASEGVIRR